MGLDMYAYTGRKGQMNEFYDQDIKYNSEKGDWDVPEGGVQKPRELAYWRKHPNLHGWMEQLWKRKMIAEGKDPSNHTFNGIELELTWDDIDNLEKTIKEHELPSTQGFFFGDNPPDLESLKEDLQFIQKARDTIADGFAVYYDSWW